MHLFHKLVGTLPISHYLLMRYAEEVSADPDQTMGFLVRMLYAEVYHVDLHPDDLVAVCARIQEHGDKVRARAEEVGRKPRPKASQKGNFSDYYNAFMDKLDMTETCLWLADMDVDKARHLYLEEDYEVVEKMADFKRGHEREQHRLLFEGPLFGFGGKYGGAGGGGRNEGDVTVHDLSQMTSAQALERIAQMSRRH